MSVGMDVKHGALCLPRQDLSSHKNLPFVIIHSKNTELKAHENGLISQFEVKAGHLMDSIIKLSFPVQVLLFVLEGGTPSHNRRILREIGSIRSELRLLEGGHRLDF